MDRPVAPAPHSIAACRERIAAFDRRAMWLTLAALGVPVATLVLFVAVDMARLSPADAPTHVLAIACVLAGVAVFTALATAAHRARRRARVLEAKIDRRERGPAW